jgi:hypothetical protein
MSNHRETDENALQQIDESLLQKNKDRISEKATYHTLSNNPLAKL